MLWRWLLRIFALLTTFVAACSQSDEAVSTEVESALPMQAAASADDNNNNNRPFDPFGPRVMCSFLPLDFLDCKDPIDHKGNKTAREEKGYGCLRFGGTRYEDVEHTSVECTAYPDIECYGPRTFLRAGVPCIRYTGHYFLTTLIYSIFLGFLGLDRFCLGHTGTAVGKLLTFGGVGVWWIIDIILLITGNLMPEDGSNWNPVV